MVWSGIEVSWLTWLSIFTIGISVYCVHASAWQNHYVVAVVCAEDNFKEIMFQENIMIRYKLYEHEILDE